MTKSCEKDKSTEWSYTKTYSDDQIREFEKSILSNPTTIIDSDIPLYTEEQMLKMFREGCLSISKTIDDLHLNDKERLRSTGVYSLLKQMGKGDSLLLPIEKWHSARASASMLKKSFGTEFIVKKTTPKGKDADTIEVVRIN